MARVRRLTLGTALLGTWWGILLFFTLAVPTALFRTVPATLLLRVLGALFPSFFLYASLAGALTLATLPWTRRSWLLVAALVLQLLDWSVLVPMTDRAVGTSWFFALHGLSLGIDVVVSVLVTGALLWFTLSPLDS
jgi:hypothetical protein